MESLAVTEKQVEIIAQGDEKYNRLAKLQELQQQEKRVIEKHRLYQDAMCSCRQIGCELGELIDEIAEFSVCPLCGSLLGESNDAVS